MPRRNRKFAVPGSKYVSSPYSEWGEESAFNIFLTKDIDGRLSFFGERKKKDSDTSIKDFEEVVVKKPLHEFCTGSRYIGLWNSLGISTHGIYRYPHGVIYEGEFNMNGQFHGFGTMIYPNGQKIVGLWQNGKLTEDISYIFSCGEPLDEANTYCQMPDRRFHVEIKEDFGPAGMECLTSDHPYTKEIPEGCYDTGYGFYNPKSRCIEVTTKLDLPPAVEEADVPSLYSDIVTHESIIEINRNTEEKMEPFMRKDADVFRHNDRLIYEIPTAERIKWIKENCRRPWDEPTGYRPDLYEHWTVGRKGFQYSREYDKRTPGTSVLPEQTSTHHSVHIKTPSQMMSFIKRKEDGAKITTLASYRGRERRVTAKLKPGELKQMLTQM